MGSIVAAGVGSGLDIDSLVKQLVAAEGQAASVRLDSKEAGFQAKLSAYGSFRSALDTLQKALDPLKDLAKFQGRAVTVGDTSVLSVTANSGAAPGNYSVEVERLARAQKLSSGAIATADTVIGIGTLTLTQGTTSVNVAIDASHNTLAGIRDAINGVSSTSGITATLITEVGGTHLVLSSNKTGAANAISVAYGAGDAGLDAFVDGITTTQTALDSRIVIDGFVHEDASNSITTAVSGVTFNLLSTSDPDVTTNVGVTYDKAAATKAVTDFVTAYNAMLPSLKGLSSYDAKTKAAGALLGDSTLRDFRSALSRELGVSVIGLGGSFSTLAEIGITSKVDGTLDVASSKLDTAMATNFDQVGQLFANVSSTTAPVDGLARRVDDLIERYTKADGMIETRTKGLQSSIDVITKSRAALNERLASVEERLRKQFTAMDTLVAQLRSTSNFLNQQLGSLTTLARQGGT